MVIKGTLILRNTHIYSLGIYSVSQAARCGFQQRKIPTFYPYSPCRVLNGVKIVDQQVHSTNAIRVLGTSLIFLICVDHSETFPIFSPHRRTVQDGRGESEANVHAIFAHYHGEGKEDQKTPDLGESDLAATTIGTTSPNHSIEHIR